MKAEDCLEPTTGLGWTWCCTLLIPALNRKSKCVDHLEFTPGLVHIERFYPETKNVSILKKANLLCFCKIYL